MQGEDGRFDRAVTRGDGEAGARDASDDPAGLGGPVEGAFVEAFRQFDVAITMAQARRPMGLPKREHIRALLEDPEVLAAWRSARGGSPTDADIDAVYEVFVPLNVEVVADYVGGGFGAKSGAAGGSFSHALSTELEAVRVRVEGVEEDVVLQHQAEAFSAQVGQALTQRVAVGQTDLGFYLDLQVFRPRRYQREVGVQASA